MTGIIATRHVTVSDSEATFGYPQLMVAYGYIWVLWFQATYGHMIIHGRHIVAYGFSDFPQANCGRV